MYISALCDRLLEVVFLFKTEICKALSHTLSSTHTFASTTVQHRHSAQLTFNTSASLPQHSDTMSTEVALTGSWTTESEAIAAYAAATKYNDAWWTSFKPKREPYRIIIDDWWPSPFLDPAIVRDSEERMPERPWRDRMEDAYMRGRNQ